MTTKRAARRRGRLRAIAAATLVVSGLALFPGLMRASDGGQPSGPTGSNPLRSGLGTISEIDARSIETGPTIRLQWRTARTQHGAANNQVVPAAAGFSALSDRGAQTVGDPLSGRFAQVDSNRTELPPIESTPADPAPADLAPPKSLEPPLPMVTQPTRQPERETQPEPLPEGARGARKITRKDAYDCAAAAKEIKRKKLSDIDLDITILARKGYEVPTDCKLAGGTFEPRHWECTNFVWTASGLCHKPLYFEETQLERYGHATGPVSQPLVSGAHFFGSVALLPYSMGVQLPGECVYALGYYRPGDCAPKMIPAFPWSLRGLAFQTGVITGGALLIP